MKDHGPIYNIDSAALKKFRSKAREGLASLDRDERRAYGAAVEAAVLAAQRSALLRGTVPLPRIYGKDEDIGANIRAQQRNALLAYAAKVRRARSHLEWQKLYDAAMAEKRTRQELSQLKGRSARAEAHIRAARARLMEAAA